MALGREIVHVGDISQRQALVLQQMHQVDGGVEESVRMLHAIEYILEPSTAYLALGFRQPHDGIDVERQSSTRTIITMWRTRLQETLVDKDDLHLEIVRMHNSRHQPVGNNNHASALIQRECLSIERHIALARLAIGVREMNRQLWI